MKNLQFFNYQPFYQNYSTFRETFGHPLYIRGQEKLQLAGRNYD